jgi:hypothetical protein
LTDLEREKERRKQEKEDLPPVPVFAPNPPDVAPKPVLCCCWLFWPKPPNPPNAPDILGDERSWVVSEFGFERV